MNNEDAGDLAAARHEAASSISASSPSATPNSSASRPHRKAYTGRSGRELSTSAAKRQSVMALGSIKHLQHMYAKTGLASNSPLRLGASGQNLPLALPGQILSEHDEPDSLSDDFPLSPSPPAQLAEKSFEVEIPSSRLQKEAVYRELAEVCEKWGLVEMERSMNPSTRREFSTASTTSTSSSFNNIIIYDRSATASPTPSDNHNESLILTLINTTTSAIRAAQRYFLSLPPEKLGESSDMSDLQLERASHRGIPALGVVTASRPIPRHSTLGVATSGRQAISPERNKQASAQSAKIPQDPLLRLRKVSLATLGALKDMEHRYRLNSPSEQPSNIEDIKDTLGDISITSSTDSVYQNPTFQIEDTSASEQSGYPNSYKGHLYRNDISLRDLSEQAQIVKQWIETVNELLNRLSSEVKTRRIRTKSGNLSQDNVPLPQWATPDCDDGDKLDRIVACLDAHLPKDLREELHRDAPDSDTLDRLADGQMLCLAYNAVLRKSQKPWGFIPQNSIHDVISLARERKKSEQLQYHDTVPAEGSSHLSVRGGGGSSSLMRRASSEGLSGDDSSTINAGSGIGKSTRIGLTFRRFENLRVFIAALKLRYLIQVRDGINVKTIARKEEGWRDMLLEIAFSWVEAAAEEKRNEDIQSD